MLSRQERKKYCCPTTTSFIIIIICKFVVFIIPFLNFLAFFVFLLSLFFLVWISLDSILFPRCTTLASLGSGYSRILLVIFLPLNTLLFRLPSICSTVIHIFPSFFASLPVARPRDQGLFWFSAGSQSSRKRPKEAI